MHLNIPLYRVYQKIILMLCITIYCEALSKIWRFIFLRLLRLQRNISNLYMITTLYFVSPNQKLFLMLTRKIPRDLVNVFLKVSDTCFSTPQCKICLLPINDTNAFCAVTHTKQVSRINMKVLPVMCSILLHIASTDRFTTSRC